MEGICNYCGLTLPLQYNKLYDCWEIPKHNKPHKAPEFCYGSNLAPRYYVNENNELSDSEGRKI